MATQTEHARGPAVVRVVEMVGVSTRGWEDAARQVVARASKTLRHVTGLDLVRSTAVVRDGRIAEYHATAKVAFVVEPAAAASTEGRKGAARQAEAPASDEFGIWGSASDIQ
jgi:flavin-binding protein dodecin